ncbi:hypothetical protein [Staphylococcus aureus]|nr:hypothetical protein [Staphylococcus aureus]HDZ8663869.1 hypothetical protein [Staphylococcus aureus]HEJ7310447.1 hypothetical protein [Staphylococcus aureus]
MTNTRRSTSSLIVHEQPKSPISEKFRGIRSNIMFANPDSAVQSIVITSEAPGAGKSTIAANLAVAYAQLFSKFTGNVVYVVNSENNNKDEVKKGKELIEATGAKLLGVVLNRMPKDKSASYYAYYGTDES